ncbi:MAG: TAXI family TRAP transporter solute-binding subunit [Pseudomonadales bacterium]
MRAFFALCALIVLAGCESNDSLNIGWVAVEPSAKISKLIADDLGRESPYTISRQQFDDSNSLTAALRAGEIDLAIIEQPAKPANDMSVLLSLYPSVLHVIAKPGMTDEANKSAYLHDIVAGHSLYAGPPGSAGYSLVERLVSDGVLPEKSKFELLDSPLGKDPDVYVVFGGILSADALRRLKDFELVGLGSIDELGKGSWVEGIAIRFPNLDPAIIPQGLYQSIGDKPTLTLAVQTLLVTRPDLDVNLAFEVTRRVSQKMPEIRAIYPLAGSKFTDGEQHSLLNLPMHPGATRYFNRDAPGYLERYAELLAFIITAVVALTSLLVALIRMRRQARKDRIDVYLDQLIKLRKTMDENDATAESVTRDVKDLQATVAEMVVQERIAADSSFVAFINLSNQVLTEASSKERSTQQQ